MFSNGVVIVCCLLFYFAMLDLNAFGVEGEEDFEVFEEDQGQVATQGKPSFDLIPLSYFHCAPLHLSCHLHYFELILFIYLLNLDFPSLIGSIDT